MNENEISFYIRKSIFEIYNELGPGLLEKVYEKTLAYDLKSKGLEVKTQVPIPIKFKDLTINLPVSSEFIKNFCLISFIFLICVFPFFYMF